MEGSKGESKAVSELVRKNVVVCEMGVGRVEGREKEMRAGRIREA